MLGLTKGVRASAGARQGRPYRQGIHVVVPAHDFAVLNKDDRDNPVVVVGSARLERLAVNVTLESHDPTVRWRMHHRRIAALKSDAVVVVGIERHEVRSAPHLLRPVGHAVAKLEEDVAGRGAQVNMQHRRYVPTFGCRSSAIESRLGRFLAPILFG